MDDETKWVGIDEKSGNNFNILPALICFFLLLSSINVKAQQYLDEKCYLATRVSKPLDQLLADGYRAIFFEENSPNSEQIQAIKQFLSTSDDPLIIVAEHLDMTPFDQLKDFIYQADERDHIFGPKLEIKKRLYIFSRDGNFLNRGKYLRDFEDDFSSGTNNLTVFRDHVDKPLSQIKTEIDDLFKYSGSLPNLFLTTRASKAEELIDSINAAIVYNAIVLEDGVKLSNISWDTTGLRSNGKIHTQVTRVRPNKRGYIFSPDVINFNQANASSIKIFRAHKRKLEDELALHLQFENNLINQVNSSVPPRFSSIKFVEDRERGWVGEFSGREEYIDFGNILGTDFEAISIAAWVYPTLLSKNRSIVGVGESFSAKILEGNLVFTTPDIKDHVNEMEHVRLNQWSFVSYVYDADDSVHFYLNANLINSLPASSLNNTSQSLIIGTNLWDEYFVGKMDDVHIWKRALSDEEIKTAYRLKSDQTELSSTNHLPNWLIYIIVLIVVLCFVMLYRNKIGPIKSIPVKYSINPVYNLRLFNAFELTSKKGLVLTNKLSPQRKELFLLTLFYTIRAGGISTRQLTNILWQEHDAKSAKNNRSTQVVRLREILALDTGIKLNYDDLWKVELEAASTCDLFQYQQFKEKNFNQALNQIQLSELLSIIGEGVLLPKFELEWLDKFKGDITNEILEMIMPCYQDKNCLDNSALMMRLTKTVSKIDPLNEQAFNYQLQVYIKAGKHGLARHTFEAYQKTYYKYYNEYFAKDFSQYIAEVQ